MAGILTPVVQSTDLQDAKFDGLVCIADKPTRLCGLFESDPGISAFIDAYREVDCADEISVHLFDKIPSRRLIYVPTGPVTRDYDDVRRFQEAACRGIKRAVSAGCKMPLIVAPNHEKYKLAERVSFLGVFHGLYTPLEVREMRPELSKKVEQIGAYLKDPTEIKILTALEMGRIVCRDIGGSDPERTAAPRIAEYVESVFKDTCVKVNVTSDVRIFEKDYPLLAAVNRAASHVPRHAARLIDLEYVGEGPIDTTLLLVGKGITYDTGGADIKAGGVMAGMHRDKCGAAAVAGFFQILAAYKPKGLKVIGAMSCVRNSVGSDCYVADEIIQSRAGCRVRVGNTDAEGRMVMADPLCQMKDKALKETNPFIFTIATLTGHVIRAYSDQYSAVVENGPAKKAGIGQCLYDAGEMSGDPFEISSLRREDYEAHAGRNEYEDAIQANNKPSTMTNRGHQNPAAFLNLASGIDKDYNWHAGRNEYEDTIQSITPSSRTDRGHQKPAAFMIRASGLDQHGCDSEQPLPYCHLDIAGSSGPYPGIPTGAPIVAMAHAYVLNRASGI